MKLSLNSLKALFVVSLLGGFPDVLSAADGLVNLNISNNVVLLKVDGDKDDDWWMQSSTNLTAWTTLTNLGTLLSGNETNAPWRSAGSKSATSTYYRAKQTAGLSLPQLVVGSEGTLAVVTAARLRLVPWYRATAAALVACRSLVDAVGLLPALRALPSLDAVELLMPEALDVTCRHLGMAPPLPPSSGGAFLLVDCAAHRDPADDLLGLLADQQGVLAVGPQREELFRIRDHVTIALGAQGVPLKLDVAVPEEPQAAFDEFELHAPHFRQHELKRF